MANDSLIDQVNIEDIEKVIRYSQDIESVNIKPLLEKWAASKKSFSRYFSGKLTYTHPEKINFNLPDFIKNTNLSQFTTEAGYFNAELYNFLSTITFNEFYNNSLEKDYALINGTVIPKGSKIIKDFKYFISDKEILYHLQNKASRIIQENKIEGYLTFSIHPLDFLSSSENTNNWRSCHSLDGDYRSGNLSYMCDSSTIVVYLADSENKVLPNFPSDVPWNSKKWRMLLHFNEDRTVCFAGRQYPFQSDSALLLIKEVFSKIITGFYRWGDWKSDYITAGTTEAGKNFKIRNRVCIIDEEAYDLQSIIKSGKGAKNYNDLLNSTVYFHPKYISKNLEQLRHGLKIWVGAAAPCVCCGENDISLSSSMLCDQCGETMSYDEQIYCECCGRRLHDGEDEIRLVNGWPVCADCYATEVTECACCGELIFRTDVYNLVRNDKIENLCYSCYLREEKK